jgi:NSS family neurotransmitter:Na+ symporter
MDAGQSRKKAVIVVGICCFFMGLPSAISMGFFSNQDWVWGLGLMVSGLFFTLAVLKVGPKKFRQEIVATSDSKVKLGKAFDILVKFFLPLQVLAILGWWFWTSYSADPHNWFKIFSPSSIGTALFQWSMALGVFIFLNKIINKKILGNHNES